MTLFFTDRPALLLGTILVSAAGLMAQPAVITSASPNPLPAGTFTITIQGTGIAANATILQAGVQLSNTKVVGNSISGVGWQGPATSTTFCVKNPGYACSNVLTVPVTTSSSSSGGSSGGGTVSAPVLTSVTPNPLSAGTVTVTVQGTGFLSGAMLYDSYGSYSMIQYSANVSGNTLTASIYQGAASTSTFCVKNPGSACSNSITVPVSSTTSSGGSGSGGGSSSGCPSGTSLLTVVNATISNPAAGNCYAPGATVTVTANAAPAGQSFQMWSGPVTNTLPPSTTVTMSWGPTTVTANFYTPQPIPYPVQSHPRLWVTPQDLPRLQSWANSGNVTYN
ncbi:MAG: hypothetical protein HY248_04730, partial [Fimbriimonas ginsengisoli]|nr:hypothetical protein [Fimbriimonas ginsengisoli]